MSMLVVTVLGPFGYAEGYPLSKSISVMAPMCSQHKGGISGIGKDAEFQFQGNGCNRGTSFPPNKIFQYELGINAANVDTPVWAGLGLPVAAPVDPTSLDFSDWRFVIVLPKPDVLVSVNPIDAAIEGLNVQHPPYTVAVRFIYKQWNGSDIPVLLNGKPATQPGGTLPVIFSGAPVGEDARLDLEIEYSAPVRDDLEHEDAVSCFETLMRTLGLSWSIGFPTRQSDVSRRSDCHAAVAWMK